MSEDSTAHGRRGLRDWLRRGHLRDLLLVAGVLTADVRGPWLLAAAAVLLPGALLHLWAKGCLRIGEEMTTSGPYRWTRNPFYVANALIDLGICFAVNRPVLTAVYFLLFFVIYRRKIREEEASLRGFFGDRYCDYCLRTPRFFPRWPRAGAPPPSTGFSWSNPNLVSGKEYPRLLRILVLPLWIAGAGWGAAWLRAETDAAADVLRGRLIAVGAVLLAVKTVQLVLGFRLDRRRNARLRPVTPPTEGTAIPAPGADPVVAGFRPGPAP